MCQKYYIEILGNTCHPFFEDYFNIISTVTPQRFLLIIQQSINLVSHGETFYGNHGKQPMKRIVKTLIRTDSSIVLFYSYG